MGVIEKTKGLHRRLNKLEWLLLFFVCLFALFLFTFNNDFPIYFHSDEPKKLKFLLTGTQDFKHPILMLQIGRLVSWVGGITDPQSIIVASRATSAVLGIVVLLTSFFLTNERVGRKEAWAVVLFLSVSPILVVHAHYYKEDLVFIASAMLALLFYFRFLDSPHRISGVLFGIGLGLAVSSQYKALLLAVLFLLYPLLDWRLEVRTVYRWMALPFAVAILLTAIINYPALIDPEQFIWGLKKETEHVAWGHTIKIYPLPQFFSFHLRHSLIPGMTLPVVGAAIAGLGYCLVSWKSLPTSLRFLVIYVLSFYLVHESTPMKPAPGYVRYMLPIAPALIILAIYFISRLPKVIFRSSVPPWFAISLSAMLIAVLLNSAYQSTSFVHGFNQNDTRIQAFNWLKQRQDDGDVYFGKYTLLPNKESGRIYKLTDTYVDRLLAAGYRYAVASSFAYNVYYFGAQLSNQTPKVYRNEKLFLALFEKYSYQEFKPKYKSFSFSSPTIRIIDLKSESLE